MSGSPTGDRVEWSRHTYDGLAEAYAEANPAIRPELPPLAERLLRHVGPAGTIVDLGCGTGRDLSYLAGHGPAVLGIDQSAGMLAVSRSVVAAPVVQGDIRAVPLREASVTGCWCVATLLHLRPDEVDVAIGEMARIVADGGMLVLGTQRGTTSRLEPDPYTGRHLRLMSRYTEQHIVATLEHHGFRATPADTGEPRGWVLVIGIRERTPTPP